jgi:hypothetical protein
MPFDFHDFVDFIMITATAVLWDEQLENKTPLYTRGSSLGKDELNDSQAQSQLENFFH